MHKLSGQKPDKLLPPVQPAELIIFYFPKSNNEAMTMKSSLLSINRTSANYNAEQEKSKVLFPPRLIAAINTHRTKEEEYSWGKMVTIANKQA
jgi:hypothetical protein